jgi:hypothetical protein
MTQVKNDDQSRSYIEGLLADGPEFRGRKGADIRAACNYLQCNFGIENTSAVRQMVKQFQRGWRRRLHGSEYQQRLNEFAASTPDDIRAMERVERDPMERRILRRIARKQQEAIHQAEQLQKILAQNSHHYQKRDDRLPQTEARAFFNGSDAVETKQYFQRLERLEPKGRLAALLMRIQKSSSRAKSYRGEYKGFAYD